jgi:hypothetical protein
MSLVSSGKFKNSILNSLFFFASVKEEILKLENPKLTSTNR